MSVSREDTVELRIFRRREKTRKLLPALKTLHPTLASVLSYLVTAHCIPLPSVHVSLSPGYPFHVKLTASHAMHGTSPPASACESTEHALTFTLPFHLMGPHKYIVTTRTCAWS
ncbi:hypothetical protein BC834DRAFT_905968 [Gloeopeniophorella convolvens]|nr:hypothetical protein BC834DRAFT_905968 [Gloeopeniophorella convolvens]